MFAARNMMLTRTSAASSAAVYDAVAAGATGTNAQPGFNHTAAIGADVFVAAQWDRSSGGVTAVTYGGAAMTLIATALHNNSATNGGLKLYQIAAAGNGSAKAVAVTTGGVALYAANAISFSAVTSADTPTVAFGGGTSPSQAFTLATGIVLQVFSNGNAGGASGAFSAFTGVTNRSNLTRLAINTATASGTAGATQSSSTPWAGVSVVLS